MLKALGGNVILLLLLLLLLFQTELQCSSACERQESLGEGARASGGHVLHFHLASMAGQCPSRSLWVSVQDSEGTGQKYLQKISIDQLG